MAEDSTSNKAAKRAFQLDETDRAILRQLQNDATQSLDQIARKVGVSKTAVWNRVQTLTQEKVILRQTVVVDPEKVGLTETFFISVKSAKHNEHWLRKFHQAVQNFDQIMEVHRLTGDIDYLIKVQLGSTREFDDFYQALIKSIELNDVTSGLSLEVVKQKTALPL